MTPKVVFLTSVWFLSVVLILDIHLLVCMYYSGLVLPVFILGVPHLSNH